MVGLISLKMLYPRFASVPAKKNSTFCLSPKILLFLPPPGGDKAILDPLEELSSCQFLYSVHGYIYWLAKDKLRNMKLFTCIEL